MVVTYYMSCKEPCNWGIKGRRWGVRRFENHDDALTEELCHWGIKGQKWGVRRFENPDGTLTEEGKNRYNKDYSEKQRLRDRAVYGKGGERRINKHMNEGYNISGARSVEAQRIDMARERSKKAANAGAVAGALAGVFAPEIIKAGAKAMSKKGIAPNIADMLTRGMSDPRIWVATSVGATFVLPKLGSAAGRSAAMAVSGYKPSKYKGATGKEAGDTAASIGNSIASITRR